jgi:hypothetical protein
MSQGAIRPETSRDREERRILEEEIATSPMKGEPLPQRLRNFRPDADAAIRGLGGPTMWMRRLRAIEDEMELHEEQLAAAVARDGAHVELRAGERADRAAQPQLPGRGAPTDGSADAGLREDQRRAVSARLPRRGVGTRTLPRRSRRRAPRRCTSLESPACWAALQGLRVDVDDRGETGAAHRDCGGGEECGGARREGARAVCLAHELRAAAAA